MTTPTQLARDLAGFERELLLTADVGLLGIYADLLEDAGQDTPARAVRRDVTTAWRLDGLARGTREHGWEPSGRSRRVAIACILDATHPVESAELRLSIASGQWPHRPGSGELKVPPGDVVERTGGDRLAGWFVSWPASRKGDRRTKMSWSHWGADGVWASRGSLRGDPARRDAAVRAAARVWVGELLGRE